METSGQPLRSMGSYPEARGGHLRAVLHFSSLCRSCMLCAYVSVSMAVHGVLYLVVCAIVHCYTFVRLTRQRLKTLKPW